MRCLVAASVMTRDCSCVPEKLRWATICFSGNSTTSSLRSILVGLVRRKCCAHPPVGRTANMTDRLVAQKKMSGPGRQHRQLKDKPQKSEWLTMCATCNIDNRGRPARLLAFGRFIFAKKLWKAGDVDSPRARRVPMPPSESHQ